MKYKVDRKELDECIAKNIVKILKEYEFDDFDAFNDDMLDATVDDPELRKALSDPRAKKAKKSAKKAGSQEMAADEKDEENSEKDEYVNTPSTEEYDETGDETGEEEGGETAANTSKADALLQQAAAQETNPLVLKCIEAGVPLRELYRIKNGNTVCLKQFDEVNLEWLAKHPNFGRKMDPYAALDMQINSDADRSGLSFKMKGAPISKKTAQAQGKTRPIDKEEEPDPQFN